MQKVDTSPPSHDHILEHIEEAFALAIKRPIADTRENVWRDTMRTFGVQTVKTGLAIVKHVDAWQQDINGPEDQDHEDIIAFLREAIVDLQKAETPVVAH